MVAGVIVVGIAVATVVKLVGGESAVVEVVQVAIVVAVVEVVQVEFVVMDYWVAPEAASLAERDDEEFGQAEMVDLVEIAG